jgi:hypothetical protein
MAKNVTTEKIQLKNVTAGFVKLKDAVKFNPANAEEVAKRSMWFVLDPTDAEHAKAIALIKSESARVAKIQFDGTIPKNMEKCWGNCDDRDKVYEGMAGMFYFTAKTDLAPGLTGLAIVGRRKGPDGKFRQLSPDDPEFPYSGAKVNGTVTAWAQNSHGRKAINGNLLAVQFVAHGTKFGGGGGVNPDDEFQALEDQGAAAGKDPFDAGEDDFA